MRVCPPAAPLGTEQRPSAQACCVLDARPRGGLSAHRRAICFGQEAAKPSLCPASLLCGRLNCDELLRNVSSKANAQAREACGGGRKQGSGSGGSRSESGPASAPFCTFQHTPAVVRIGTSCSSVRAHRQGSICYLARCMARGSPAAVRCRGVWHGWRALNDGPHAAAGARTCKVSSVALRCCYFMSRAKDLAMLQHQNDTSCILHCYVILLFTCKKYAAKLDAHKRTLQPRADYQTNQKAYAVRELAGGHALFSLLRQAVRSVAEQHPMRPPRPGALSPAPAGCTTSAAPRRLPAPATCTNTEGRGEACLPTHTCAQVQARHAQQPAERGAAHVVVDAAGRQQLRVSADLHDGAVAARTRRCCQTPQSWSPAPQAHAAAPRCIPRRAQRQTCSSSGCSPAD